MIFNTSAELKRAKSELAKKDYSSAISTLHRLLVWVEAGSAEFNEAHLLMAEACDGNGQHFFASEFARHAGDPTGGVAEVASLLGLPSEELTEWVGQRNDLVLRYRQECLYALGATLHARGVPVQATLSHLRLEKAHLVSEQIRYVSCMSWWIDLPFSLGTSSFDSQEPLRALVTAFDRAFCEDVDRRFRQTLDVLSKGIGDGFPTFGACLTAHLGVLVRVDARYVHELNRAGMNIRRRGLDITDCPSDDDVNNPESLIRKAEAAARVGEYLFCRTYYETAAKAFKVSDNLFGAMNALIGVGVTCSYLEEEQAARRAFTEATSQAESAGLSDFVEVIDGYRRERSVQAPEYSPYWFDPATGKVIGGCLPEEAHADFEAGRLLCDEWTQEYPGLEAPFSQPVSVTSFEWDVPITDDPTRVRRMTLAQIMSAFQDLHRLRDVDSLSVIVEREGSTPETHLCESAIRLFRALRLMHWRLGGTFSSDRGTSLSAGNVSSHGRIYDYETVSTPLLGDGPTSRSFQLLDVANTVGLLVEIAQKLGRIDLFPIGLRKGLEQYIGIVPNEVAAIADDITVSVVESRIASHDSVRRLAELLLQDQPSQIARCD